MILKALDESVRMSLVVKIEALLFSVTVLSFCTFLHFCVSTDSSSPAPWWWWRWCMSYLPVLWHHFLPCLPQLVDDLLGPVTAALSVCDFQHPAANGTRQQVDKPRGGGGGGGDGGRGRGGGGGGLTQGSPWRRWQRSWSTWTSSSSTVMVSTTAGMPMTGTTRTARLASLSARASRP